MHFLDRESWEVAEGECGTVLVVVWYLPPLEHALAKTQSWIQTQDVDRSCTKWVPYKSHAEFSGHRFQEPFASVFSVCFLTSLCEDKQTAPQTIPSKQSNRHRSFFFLTLKGLGQGCSRKSKGYVGAPLISEKMSDMAPRVVRMIVANILGPVLELGGIFVSPWHDFFSDPWLFGGQCSIADRANHSFCGNPSTTHDIILKAPRFSSQQDNNNDNDEDKKKEEKKNRLILINFLTFLERTIGAKMRGKEGIIMAAHAKLQRRKGR